MQEHAQRALKLLNVITEQTTKGERLADLLRDPETGTTPGWFIHVPAWFNNALDIRQTERKVDGKPVLTWTQGPNFDFCVGDLLYDTPQEYEVWSEALKHINLCIQVKAAKPRSSSENRKLMDPGLVTFEMLRPTPDRKALAIESSHSLSQDSFVRFLIAGTGLTSNDKQ